jgi:hypothetical protein
VCSLHAVHSATHAGHGCAATLRTRLSSRTHHQVVSWWGPAWREGTHDTQGVNTDAVLGLVVSELEQQQQVKLAFHMEPYQGVRGTVRARARVRAHARERGGTRCRHGRH